MAFLGEFWPQINPGENLTFFCKVNYHPCFSDYESGDAVL